MRARKSGRTEGPGREGHFPNLTGSIALKPGITLLLDVHTALFASRDPQDYDLTPGGCGQRTGRGCRPVNVTDRAPGSGIMGDGVIDGRGGATLAQLHVVGPGPRGESKGPFAKPCRACWWHGNPTTSRCTVSLLKNSPNFHVLVEQSNGFTAWGVKIEAPQTARNVYGIDPSSSSNGTIAYRDIATGDDDVAIQAGVRVRHHT